MTTAPACITIPLKENGAFTTKTPPTWFEDSSYFVYVEQGTEIFPTHCRCWKPGFRSFLHGIEPPRHQWKSEAQVVASTYYNPNSSRNDFNYGAWYDGANWNLYTEDASSIQFGDAFLVAINSPSTVAYRHVAAAGTVVSNWTNISHPLLDGNSDARFVFFHNWGESGQTSNVVINKTMELGIPELIGLSIMRMALPSLQMQSLTYWFLTLPWHQRFEHCPSKLGPNPVSSSTTVTATETIKQIAISNVLGQIVKVINGTGTQQTIDLSSLSPDSTLPAWPPKLALQVIKLLKQ